MAIFAQTERQLNLSEIEELEKLVGLNFPFEYKNHLLKHNGGQCSPNVFRFKEDDKLTTSCIDWFLAIYDGEYDNLKTYIEILKIDKKRMPIHLLPFAHDPAGNMLCISCDPKNFGPIYFWNHEKEVNYTLSDDNDYSNLYLISKSFKDFLYELKKE